MTAINDYIKNLIKCNNVSCTFKLNCLRYSNEAKEKFSFTKNHCDYYFESKLKDSDEIDYLKKVFGI